MKRNPIVKEYFDWERVLDPGNVPKKCSHKNLVFCASLLKNLFSFKNQVFSSTNRICSDLQGLRITTKSIFSLQHINWLIVLGSVIIQHTKFLKLYGNGIKTAKQFGVKEYQPGRGEWLLWNNCEWVTRKISLFISFANFLGISDDLVDSLLKD